MNERDVRACILALTLISLLVRTTTQVVPSSYTLADLGIIARIATPPVVYVVRSAVSHDFKASYHCGRDRVPNAISRLPLTGTNF